jgi:hypothetical protein
LVLFFLLFLFVFFFRFEYLDSLTR